MRFEIIQRDEGGFGVWDTKHREWVGGECSHLGNAEVKAARLNGTREFNEDWFRFYGATA